MVPAAYRAGAKVVIVNAEPTEHDAIAEVIVHAPISEALPQMVRGD